jgi:biotin operon repressor
MSLAKSKERFDRIYKIHQLIEKEMTGSGEEFAEKICISRSLLMEYIKEMKTIWGAPIKYCRQRNTYYYIKKFRLTILLEAELLNTRGGIKINFEKVKHLLIRTTILVWLCCFFVFPTAGQNYALDYYPNINKAEEYILLGNQKLAFETYLSVFSRYQSVFAKDLFNAIHCGNNANPAHPILFDWFKKLFNIGIDEEFLRTEILVKLKNKALIAKIQSNWSATKAERERLTNFDLINKLNDLYTRDQRYRARKGGYKIFKDSIKYDDINNIKELIKIVKKHGFPSEMESGVQKPGEKPKFFIVLHHFCQTVGRDKNYYNCCIDEVIAMIEQAVLSGKMHPSTASTYISWANMKNKRLSSTDYKLESNELEKRKISDYRKRLGLQTVEEVTKRSELLSRFGRHNFIFELR